MVRRDGTRSGGYGSSREGRRKSAGIARFKSPGSEHIAFCLSMSANALMRVRLASNRSYRSHACTRDGRYRLRAPPMLMIDGRGTA